MMGTRRGEKSRRLTRSTGAEGWTVIPGAAGEPRWTKMLPDPKPDQVPLDPGASQGPEQTLHPSLLFF